MDDKVALRAAYERFPAAIKGAFLLRGADGLPHQVRIESARATDVAGRVSAPIAIEPSIIEVSPTMDTFVPFEVPTLDLASGWYQLGCDVQVDGVAHVAHPGARFLIPWPRSAVRRGTVDLRKKAGPVMVESVECASDSVRVGYVAEKAPTITITADGAVLALIEVEHDDEAGRGRVVAYPALRAHGRLAVQVKGSPPIEVSLP